MKKSKKIFKVLVIDGGGIRGIVPARILQEIEKKTGKPISELFDLIGGASTGAILAAGITVRDPNHPHKPKFTAADLVKFYYEEGAIIFPTIKYRDLKHFIPGTNGFYDSEPLEKKLKEKFADAQLKDALTHIVIPATDIKNYQPVWMTNFKQKGENPYNWSRMKLRDATRASAAAPTYFKTRTFNVPQNDIHLPMHITDDQFHLIDGSIFSGNMARRLYTFAKQLAPEGAEIVMIHVGTGFPKHSMTAEQYNKLGPLGLISKENDAFMINLFLNMGIMSALDDLKEELGKDHFFSFDSILDKNEKDSPSRSMDDASVKNLDHLIAFAEKIIADPSRRFDEMCHLISKNEDCPQTLSTKTLAKLSEHMSKCETVKELDAFLHAIERTKALQEPPMHDFYNIFNDVKVLNDHDYKELTKTIYPALRKEKAKYEGVMGTLHKWTDKSMTSLSKIFGKKSRKADFNHDQTTDTKKPYKNNPK